ncbi:MAG: 16S rRNA (uracil(1498)-N(3))-methyltransferase [Chitinivibrionales bacterium]|nr:16S rRNA (uracil(1498)-N(3))-methyltransferase [Chitinivibrionales bacterium]
MTQQQEHFLFYSEAIEAETIVLTAQEACHASSVLRLKSGCTIFVTDGKATIYSGVLEQADKHRVVVRIVQRRVEKPLLPRIHCCIGLPSKESFEQALEALVALGVATIVPLVCQYCQQPWWKNSWNKLSERFQKKMIASLKQSWNPTMPQLVSPIAFSERMKKEHGSLVIADMEGSITDSIIPDSCTELSCYIGPPGGFSPQEIDLLKQSKDACFIKISPFRLRTELAATILVGLARYQRSAQTA